MDDGTLYTFGDNSDGQCTGLALMYPTPKKIAEELKGKIIDIFCGYNYCIIIMGKENIYQFTNYKIHLDNGDMYSWGDNSYGKLTLMEMTQNINYPRILQILKGKYVNYIALGYFMTIISTSTYDNSIIKINKEIEEKNNNNLKS
jgi:alpha-tubulin suppressor-like RCC1 family protein